MAKERNKEWTSDKCRRTVEGETKKEINTEEWRDSQRQKNHTNAKLPKYQKPKPKNRREKLYLRLWNLTCPGSDFLYTTPKTSLIFISFPSYPIIYIVLLFVNCLSQSTSAHSFSFHYHRWPVFLSVHTFRPIASLREYLQFCPKKTHTRIHCVIFLHFHLSIYSELIHASNFDSLSWIPKHFVWPFASAEKRSDDETSNASGTKPTYDVNVRTPSAPKPLPSAFSEAGIGRLAGGAFGEPSNRDVRRRSRPVVAFFIFQTPKPMDERTLPNGTKWNQIQGADVEEAKSLTRGSDSEMVPSSPSVGCFQWTGDPL